MSPRRPKQPESVTAAVSPIPYDPRSATLRAVQMVAAIEPLPSILGSLRDAYAVLGTPEGDQEAAFLEFAFGRATVAVRSEAHRQLIDLKSMAGQAMLITLALSLRPPKLKHIPGLADAARGWVAQADLRSIFTALWTHYDAKKRKVERNVLESVGTARWGAEWMAAPPDESGTAC